MNCEYLLCDVTYSHCFLTDGALKTYYENFIGRSYALLTLQKFSVPHRETNHTLLFTGVAAFHCAKWIIILNTCLFGLVEW